MVDPSDGPPLVALPERLDRRLRLGPFPSARDALKFVTYAAAGAVLAPFVFPILWVPVVGAGFVVSVWKPDGRAIDERCLDFLAWRLRALRAGSPRRSAVRRATLRGRLLKLAGGQFVAIVRAEGVPLAYLPPDELARRFDWFRELLRGTSASLTFLASSGPIRPTDVLPPAAPIGAADREARSGYAQLVDLISRRRAQRRIYVALTSSGSGTDGLSELDRRADDLRGKLAGLGARPARLSGRSLRDAGRRFGWPPEETPR